MPSWISAQCVGVRSAAAPAVAASPPPPPPPRPGKMSKAAVFTAIVVPAITRLIRVGIGLAEDRFIGWSDPEIAATASRQVPRERCRYRRP